MNTGNKLFEIDEANLYIFTIFFFGIFPVKKIFF